MNPFNRTQCACDRCVQCCKRQPGPLAVGDFERIASFMRLDLDRAKSFFRNSPGAVVSVAGEPYRIRTIVPAADRSGRCVFLDRDDRCQIHEVAPFGCAFFDMHMAPDVANVRAIWYLREIDSDESYGRLRRSLQFADTYNPTHA